MRKSCKRILEEIKRDFPDVPFEKTDEKNSFAKNGKIYLVPDTYDGKTMVGLFDVLHEIGHVYGDEKWMFRSEREWRASTWAIMMMRKYGIKLPAWRKKNFQDDIYFWYEVEKAFLVDKNRMSKTQLKLFWRDEE